MRPLLLGFALRSTLHALRSTSLLLAAALLVFGAEQESTSVPRFIWPLEIDEGLSSTFGEYRPDHLHGGIDLKTRGESGFAVFAAADGDIYRFKCERRGYGKVVYVRHADDWVTVYAHLERFENDTLKLEDMLHSLQHSMGTPYIGNYYLDHPIHVAQGQIIGYSGESGAGLPHLHFETRRGELEQVNPFVAGLGWRADPNAPTILSATLIPDGALARVGDRVLPVILPFRKTQGSYTWAQPVTVRPPLRMLLTAYDVEGTTNNSCHIYSIRALLDGRELFRSSSDRFALSPALRVGLIFDLNRNGKYPSAFTYTLDPRATAYLPFASSSLPIAALPPGLHHLDIRVADVWGNTATAVGDLLVPGPARVELGPAREAAPGEFDVGWKLREDTSAQPLIEVSHDGGESFVPVAGVEGTSGTMRIRLTNPLLAPTVLVRAYAFHGSSRGLCSVMAINALESSLSPVAAAGIDSEGRMRLTLKRPLPYTMIPVGFEPFSQGPSVKVPAGETVAVYERPQLRSKLVRALIELPAGAPLTSIVIPWYGPAAGPSSELLPARNFVSFQLTYDRPRIDWDGNATVTYPGGAPTAVRFDRLDERTFLAALDLPPLSGKASIAAADWTTQFDLRRVRSDSEQRFVDDNLMVVFDRGSAYTDFFLWIQRDKPFTDSRLLQIGDIFRIYPEGEPLALPAHIQMQYPIATKDSLKLGVYSWDPDGFWVYERTAIDRTHRLAMASVRRLGRYALLEDHARPEITFVTPRPGARVYASALRSVLVEIVDYGKGVDEDSIQMSLDGHRLTAIYDPDRKWAAHVFQSPIRKGRHTLRVTARDLAGNAAVPASAVFTVR